MENGKAEDAYGKIQYRGLIAWPERLRREKPLLERALGTAPNQKLLDLGCGTGEHSRFLRSLGFEVLGVDASEAQLRAAREADPDEEGDARPRYVQGDLGAIGSLVPAGFGGAICLGNTLPHLKELDTLQGFFAGLAGRLVSGAPFLMQLLNYDRILDRGERTFPLSLRPGEAPGEEIIFMRLMTPRPDGTLIFTPATLRYRPGLEPPLELVSAQNVQLRGWRRSELEGALQATGFELSGTFGSMTGDPWGPEASDLVLWARKGSPEKGGPPGRFAPSASPL
ncbi:MAG: class I SAM-dependent methyltransferase [Acidobacteriota bacterium]|nr:class I SAM-dependent methyltransferase [Acidobacteriota bacterium]